MSVNTEMAKALVWAILITIGIVLLFLFLLVFTINDYLFGLSNVSNELDTFELEALLK
jgi:hypothetical protein